MLLPIPSRRRYPHPERARRLKLTIPPPEILDLQCDAEGNHLRISFRAIDRRSTIQKAEYSLDGGEWRAAFPVTRLSDSGEEEYLFNSEDVFGSAHTVVVRVSDRFENTGVGKVVWKAPEPASR